MNRKRITSFLVASAGLVIEHFDVMLINLFATSMVNHFFYADNSQKVVILGFIGYGITFLFRPLGAILFGLVGDVMGRRSSMLLSLFCMSIATLFLGLIPSYQSLGILSTLLFILCRICQGLSIGGEYGSAMTYAYEFTEKKKTFSGSLIVSATHFGGLAASLLASRFTHGFQTAFIIAGIVGFIALAFRSQLVETQPHLKNSSKTSPMGEVLKTALQSRSAYRKAFITGASLVFVLYSTLIYLNEVIYQRHLASREEIFISNSFLLILWIILAPVLGYGVDRWEVSYKKLMMGGALGVSILSFPILFFASERNTFQSLVLAQFLLSALHCLYCYGTPRYLGELFETKVRNTGLSLGYSLGASFTAAITPLVCQGLVTATNSLMSIGLPILVLSGLMAYQLFQEAYSNLSASIGARREAFRAG